MREVAIWLHIIGGSMWLGTNIAQAAIGPKLMADERAALPWLKAVAKASGPVYGAASGLILITGVYLVLSSNGAYTFGTVFVTIGLAILIILGALGGLVFNKKTKQMVGMLEGGNAALVAPAYKSLSNWGILDTALMAVAILAMVSKWGA
jgi:uncharacterized membrane protein